MNTKENLLTMLLLMMVRYNLQNSQFIVLDTEVDTSPHIDIPALIDASCKTCLSIYQKYYLFVNIVFFIKSLVSILHVHFIYMIHLDPRL